jgi:hypothetical protein
MVNIGGQHTQAHTTMKLKSAIATFIAILAGTCIIPFLNTYTPQTEIEENKPAITVQVETNAATNVTFNATNALDRGKTSVNVDWFKDGSNYIWDGWKIK